MHAVAQRCRQGARALFAFARSPDLGQAQRYLTDCEYQAFVSMSRADQLHSLQVLRSVLDLEPEAPRGLAAAALLHDVGKSRYHLAVWQKTLPVLVKIFAPDLSQRLSHDGPLSWWRAPFTVHQRHPAWSGDILRRCSSDPSTIWLAEHHQVQAARCQDHPLYPLLVTLQQADAVN